MTNVDYGPALRWASEREAIRVRKERGDPFPWTDDPILRDYRFCCVRREDDRVTKWIDENVRSPFAGHPLLWLMLAIARVVNWPETLAELIDVGSWPSNENFKPEYLEFALYDRARRGEKVFTGAYVITAPQVKGTSKAEFVARSTIGKLWESREVFERHFAGGPTLRRTHELMTRYNGWGPFMAYQWLLDLRYTDVLRNAADVESWAAAGPGTIRGLNRLHGRSVDAALSQERALGEIRRTWETVKLWGEVKMDFNDVTGLFCEFDKYERVRLGEGAPRARYVPGRGS